MIAKQAMVTNNPPISKITNIITTFLSQVSQTFVTLIELTTLVYKVHRKYWLDKSSFANILHIDNYQYIGIIHGLCNFWQSNCR